MTMTPLSITTDFRSDTGCPQETLREVAAAGFTHVHWCHHWSSDFLYDAAEIRQIKQWLDEYNLKLLDLHGSAGKEKCWWSLREYERLAGVELVRNRIEMTTELGGASVVMHVPRFAPGEDRSAECDQVLQSVDALVPVARRNNVRLAFENMRNDDFRFLRKLLDTHGPDVAGLCYDCGHGNINDNRGLDHLESLKDRLIAVHLHDNDGTADQHLVPFTGTVDFPRLANILARSSYRGCVSMESSMRFVPEEKRAMFLSDAMAAGKRLTDMIGANR